ncbi:class I SAM-dependent methyltransferase [Thermoflexus sp.]|uniref:class I SAM-dependent methyltransferase n=1 Tax=Thermoflexus sp. TaxID=1969742 RepID=UPI002ADE234E|nr:class I SAM-dependent methyltransferase [Thermoflexus sp.]
MNERAACPICEWSEGNTRMIRRREFSYVRCRRCGTIYLTPVPPVEQVRAMYQNPGYFAGDEDMGYRNYEAMHKALAPHFRRRLRVLSKRLPRRGCLLDIGCADGYFLELARADGWEVMGVEISEEMASKASGRLSIPIVTSVDGLPPVELDVITMWEVLEHLPDPVAQLQRLVQRLRPGGFLMLSTPNAGHWQALREPETWTAYRPPAHLVLFTADSLRLALEKAGLVPIRVWKVSPLPPLPGWIRQATRSLARALADGSARPWTLALMLWRGVRLLGWAWQKAAHPQDDIFATLEALACRPA